MTPDNLQKYINKLASEYGKQAYLRYKHLPHIARNIQAREAREKAAREASEKLNNPLQDTERFKFET